jgi:hypothetical protein
MANQRTVQGHLIDSASGAIIVPNGIEFSDGTVQTTAATVSGTQSFNFAPVAPATAFTVEGGTITNMVSTEQNVTGGLAVVSFNITTLAVTALVASSPAVLQLTLTPNGSSTIFFERQLTFVTTSQGGSAYNGAALVNVPAGTTGLKVAAELFDTAGTIGSTLQVELVPQIRVDYVPF